MDANLERIGLEKHDLHGARSWSARRVPGAILKKLVDHDRRVDQCSKAAGAEQIWTHQQSKDDREGDADSVVCWGSPIHKIVLPEQQLELVPVVLRVGLVKVDGLAAFLGHLVILYESLSSAAQQDVPSPSACEMLSKVSGRNAKPFVHPMPDIKA